MTTGKVPNHIYLHKSLFHAINIYGRYETHLKFQYTCNKWNVTHQTVTTEKNPRRVCLLVGCLMSQQHASVSQGRICEDNFMCCHTETEVADQTFYLTQSQYTDTKPTSPSADPITPGAWQGSHWSANFWVTGMTQPRKSPGASGIQIRDLLLLRRIQEEKIQKLYMPHYYQNPQTWLMITKVGAASHHSKWTTASLHSHQTFHSHDKYKSIPS